jgi:hypothetical protein
MKLCIKIKIIVNLELTIYSLCVLLFSLLSFKLVHLPKFQT